MYNPQSMKRPYRKPAAPKNSAKGHQGKAFEKIIEGACKQYRTRGLADIEKVPTPVQITSRNGRNVTGRLEHARFTDFEGILKGGRGIAFEAKEHTKSIAFPLSHIEIHQYEKMKSYHMMGGIAFLLVYRVHYKKVYRVPFEVLHEIWEAAQDGGQKSIPQEVFETRCIEVKPKYNSALDFLEGIIEIEKPNQAQLQNNRIQQAWDNYISALKEEGHELP